MSTLLAVLFLIVCILLIIVVLLQKGRGGGLSAAFGGGGGSAFGTKTGDVFTWVTIVLTALFLLMAIGTTLMFRPEPGTVDAPRINPGDNTEIREGEEIFVTMENQVRGAVIHYTTDGTDPTTTSPAYEKPFPVKAGMTVKARAYRSGGWTPSVIVSASYRAPKARSGVEEETATQPAMGPATAPAAPATAPAAPATAPAAPAAKTEEPKKTGGLLEALKKDAADVVDGKKVDPAKSNTANVLSGALAPTTQPAGTEKK